MDGAVGISLDKLPMKRLEVIEENGAERFPSDVGYDDKRVSLIRRIDFAWALEEEDETKKNKKQKKSSKESSGPWQWQGMVENLQSAHQELSVIIDLINTVEANDAVTVAGMTRPKPLPNEHLSDLAVSTATKLQSYRHLGKYFKQSAKALEQQINREARFYGALIRLQRNWKVKRQRVAASSASNEGFTIDLSDGLLYDPSSAMQMHPSSLSTIRVDHDSAGMLAINLPKDSCHSLRFGFLGFSPTDNLKKSSKLRDSSSVEEAVSTSEMQPANDDESVKKTHLLLRQVHKSIFAEQLFGMVNGEAFNQAVGVNVTGIRENYLQISIGQGASLFISLLPSSKSDKTKNSESTNLPIDPSDGMELTGERVDSLSKNLGFPNRISCEIYLQQIFHEHVFGKAKDQSKAKGRAPNKTAKDAPGLLGHFCLSLAHRIFSNRVLAELESVVCRVTYLRLASHPTWNSRISSWTVFMNVPSSIAPPSCSETQYWGGKKNVKSQFRTKVVVNGDSITVEGECSPNVVGLFKGSSCNLFSTNKYDCDLADLPVTILQQVASQILCWLLMEAQTVGVKASRDFLTLVLEIEQGEFVTLSAHVDPEDAEGCISWWLAMEDGSSEERSFHTEASDGKSDYRRFLGHLSLEVLHSTLMDLISLCGGGRTV